MSEKLPIADSQPQLEDVTTEARAHIISARASGREGIARPPRLYIELPGHTINFTIHDSDCSGHWTEERSFTLSDAPHRIISVTTGNQAMQLKIARNEQDTYGFETTLYDSDIRRAKFYVSEIAPEDQALTAALYEQLSAHSAVWIDKKYLDELGGWESEVGVRAAHPLSSPVSVHDDTHMYALDTRSIVGIQSFYDEDRACTMTQVVTEGRRSNSSPSSDWAPLEDFEFYRHKYSETDAALGRIAHEAAQLLGNDTSPTVVNQLLADATPRVVYEVLYDRYDYAQPARFIVGDITPDGVIQHARIPTLHRYSDTVHVAMAADRIVTHNGTPWVVDDTNNLATPLISPAKFTNSKRYFGAVPMEKLIVREQTE